MLVNLTAWAEAADAAVTTYAAGYSDPFGLFNNSPAASGPPSTAHNTAIPACTCTCAAVNGTAPVTPAGFGSQVLTITGSSPWALAGNGDPSLVVLSWISIAWASLLVSVAMSISIWLRLNLEVKLFVAAVRCVVQLSILGYILVPIFDNNNIPVVLGYSLFMVLVAAVESSGRPSYTYKGLFLSVLLSLGSAATFTLAYALLVIIRVDPWYDARYFIPLLGMLLGNAVSSVSVGLTTVLEDLSSGKDKVELLLALGATRMEAARAVLQRSVMVALTPILNQLSVVGIVSIPGMLSGQVLSGSPPQTAARYQIMIMFLVTATAALGSTCAVLCTVLTVIDRCHRLRSERLVPRTGHAKGLNGLINSWVQKLVDLVTAAVVAVVKGIAGVFRSIFHNKSQASTEPILSRAQASLGAQVVNAGQTGSNGPVGADLSRPLLANST